MIFIHKSPLKLNIKRYSVIVPNGKMENRWTSRSLVDCRVTRVVDGTGGEVVLGKQ